MPKTPNKMKNLPDTDNFAPRYLAKPDPAIQIYRSQKTTYLNY